MIFNILEQEWFQLILGAVALGISTLIGVGFDKLIKLLTQKGLSEKYARVLETTRQLIQDAVLMVQQTYVEQLKKDGKFTPENQKEALNKVVKTVTDSLSVEAANAIQEIYGDVTKWVKIQVEALVYTILPHNDKKDNNINNKIEG